MIPYSTSINETILYEYNERYNAKYILLIDDYEKVGIIQYT